MCCNEKNRVKTTESNSQYVRFNGWSLPLNCMQVFAWMMLILFAFMAFGVETLALPSTWWPYVYTVIGLLYLFHFVFHIIATTINPADDRSIERMKQRNQPYPVFDRTAHSHVIENNYCYICEVSVSERSKHCSACNKCVAGFDHHCKWLNNCIGEKNYNMFLGTLISAILGAVGMAAISLYVFINAVQDFKNLNIDVWWNSSLSLRIVFLVFLGIKIFMLICCLFLIIQLLFFHLMLMQHKTSTYDYIKQKIQVKEERKRQKEQEQENDLSAVENGTICNAESDVIETSRRERVAHPQTVPTVESTPKNQNTAPKEEFPKHALMKNKHITQEPNQNIVPTVVSNTNIPPDRGNEVISPQDNPSYVTDDDSVLTVHSISNNIANVVVHVDDNGLLPNAISENGDQDMPSKNPHLKKLKKNKNSSNELNGMLMSKNSKLPPLRASRDSSSEEISIKKRKLPSLPTKNSLD